jgi:hypothetical protein
VVKELIARGAPVNARDGQGRTALQLAVKACVDSYWTELRSPESIRALLAADASKEGITLPTGYDDADKLLASALAASTLHIVDGESVAGTLREAAITRYRFHLRRFDVRRTSAGGSRGRSLA